MLRLAIPDIEILIWRPKNVWDLTPALFEAWLHGKLHKAGFDLKKYVYRYYDAAHLQTVFCQNSLDSKPPSMQ